MEVLEGVRWNRKRYPEPNLRVCGEDDIKRAVYNMKESIEKRRSGHQKQRILRRKPYEPKN